MPIYHYQALDSRGQIHKGKQDGASEHEIRQWLKSQQLYPTEVKISRFSRRDQGKGSTKASEFVALIKKWIPQNKNYLNNLTLFTRQLEVLLDATIPYDKALELIIVQTEDPDFQSILSDVRSRIVEGGYLADALANHEYAFPSMYISMVRQL